MICLSNEHYSVFIKGAPEIIARICKPNTIPSNFETVLNAYTLQGYRVLALGSKTFGMRKNWSQILKMPRKEVEEDVELLGLLVMQNTLKKETFQSIRILHQARILTTMVTGDNLRTAITVAKECEMIEKEKRVIQIEAKWIPVSANSAAHLQVTYTDPLIAPEFLKGTVSFVTLWALRLA